MKRTPVESSNLVSVGYENGILEIEFRGQSLYRYFSVPEEVYQGLMIAESHGKFLHQNVKGVFRYEKIPYSPSEN